MARVVWARGIESCVLKVPLYSCKRCLEVVHAHPLRVGCFPATPQRALHLGEAGSAEEAVWYDCRLLRLILEKAQRSPDLADEAVCGAIEAVAADVDGVKLSQKRMQSHFAFVLVEYLLLWKTLEHPGTLVRLHVWMLTHTLSCSCPLKTTRAWSHVSGSAF